MINQHTKIAYRNEPMNHRAMYGVFEEPRSPTWYENLFSSAVESVFELRDIAWASVLLGVGLGVTITTVYAVTILIGRLFQ